MVENKTRIISRHAGTVVMEIRKGVVLKAGERVRPAERLAMELVLKHTNVPVPEPMYSYFRPSCGEIEMPLVPGVCLKDVWRDLDAQAKTSICTQIWTWVEQWRCIRKPLELQHLYACTVDGKFGDSALISGYDGSIQRKDSDILTDEALRKRICENYYTWNGRKHTKAQLFTMLPRSDNPSVFTHGDLRPKNIMVSGSQVTGIIDWEVAGWYPEYWEYIGFSHTHGDGDWQTFMTACAPRTWDLEGIRAASRVLL